MMFRITLFHFGQIWWLFAQHVEKQELFILIKNVILQFFDVNHVIQQRKLCHVEATDLK